LFAALKSKLRTDIEVIEIDANINDAVFAEQCAAKLLEQLQAVRG
jgi:hypothetical protein